MKNGYEKYIEKVWNAKESVYKNFLKSGIDSYAEYINKRVEQMRKKGVVSDKVFELIETKMNASIK